MVYLPSTRGPCKMTTMVFPGVTTLSFPNVFYRESIVVNSAWYGFPPAPA